MKKESEKDASLEWTPRFGNIAVEMGYATSDQIKHAMKDQADDDIQRRPRRPLGRILFERDWMSHSEVEMVLNELFKKTKMPNRNPRSFF